MADEDALKEPQGKQTVKVRWVGYVFGVGGPKKEDIGQLNTPDDPGNGEAWSVLGQIAMNNDWDWMGELGHEVLLGDPGAIHASMPRRQKTPYAHGNYPLTSSISISLTGLEEMTEVCLHQESIFPYWISFSNAGMMTASNCSKQTFKRFSVPRVSGPTPRVSSNVT